MAGNTADTKLTERSCAEFCALLGSKAPVPGGGGAAALAGALASSLCSMVGAYTSGKKAYAAVQADIERLLAEAEEARVELLGLVEADAEAFSPLAAAYAIPRDDPSRDSVLDQATRGALVPPLEMMRAIARVVALLEEMGEKGSRMLLSDVACGAYLAASAMQAASVNVFVNTASLKDRAFAATVEAEADELLATWVGRAEALAQGLVARIRA